MAAVVALLKSLDEVGYINLEAGVELHFGQLSPNCARMPSRS